MPNSSTPKLLRELVEGDKFAGFVVLRRLEVRQKKDGSPYLVLEFADKSGRLSGRIWDDVEEHRKALADGNIVKLQATVEIYQDQKQLKIERVRLAKTEDPVDRSRLIPVSERPPEELRRHLRRLVESLKKPPLRNFLRRFFDDPEIDRRFFEAPAGQLWHHAYLGGLAEHSLAMAEVLLKAAENYPAADTDMLVAGALLHDIGKIEELTWDLTIEYSDRGRLIGHLVISQDLLNQHRTPELEVPEELWNRLMHMILSHHGSREMGAPVVPMTLEAVLLYHADEMDAKANAFNRIIQRTREQGEHWSEKVRLIDRYLYAGEKAPEEGGEGELF
jgi:3'-5' exoribonuclease